MIKKYCDLVKFSHTIFALPFAMIGFCYALFVDGYSFDGWLLLKILVCMVTARNTAMGFNRWADRDIDAQNPRTASREIPAGKISARTSLIFVICNALLFVACAATINTLAALLSPVALFIVMIYSYCKRFTWAAHLVLGLALSIAPVGAYIAVAGEFALMPCLLAFVVINWCGGFDIIYALQDYEFDKGVGLHSIPTKFGVRGALTISSALHALSCAALVAFAILLPHNTLAYIGTALFIAILILEHLLVTANKQDKIGIAFGTLNGLASVTLAIFVILGMVLSL